MKRVLVRVCVAAALVLGLGFAFALGFDESGFDFSDSGIATAYLTLSRVGGGLVVHFDDATSAGVVGTIDVDNQVAGFDTSDPADFQQVSKVRTTMGYADVFAGVTLQHCACDFTQMTFLHDGQALSIVEAAYTDRLQALGYTLTRSDVSSNIHTYEAVQGDETVRLVFARQGTDTQVTLKSM